MRAARVSPRAPRDKSRFFAEARETSKLWLERPRLGARQTKWFSQFRAPLIVWHAREVRDTVRSDCARSLSSGLDAHAQVVHAGAMARRRIFRLFPRYRRPSTGELLGTTQAKRSISRRYHLASFRDPMVGVRNMQRRAKRRVGYYSEPAKFVTTRRLSAAHSSLWPCRTCGNLSQT